MKPDSIMKGTADMNGCIAYFESNLKGKSNFRAKKDLKKRPRPARSPNASIQAQADMISPIMIGFRHRVQNNIASVRARSRFLRRPCRRDRDPSNEDAGYPKKGLRTEVGDNKVDVGRSNREGVSDALISLRAGCTFVLGNGGTTA